MCGIAGLVSPRRIDPDLLKRMGDVIAHRGPDDHGTWIDTGAGVGFSHRRLAILDLSPHGQQPMHSADGRLVLNFNGEIYNHGALRAELEAGRGSPQGGWRGHSDTETLVEAIAAWGLAAAIGKAVGMFAFALWDREERVLSLVRDRFGEKPLYYGWAGKDFIFGSELKSLRLHPAFDGTIDRQALGLYAARAYVPAPRSIYRSIFKLEPASILSLTLDAALRSSSRPPPATHYWSYRDVVREGLAKPITTEVEAIEELDGALGHGVMGRSMAAVPCAAFLSGGVDGAAVFGTYQPPAGDKVRHIIGRHGDRLGLPARSHRSAPTARLPESDRHPIPHVVRAGRRASGQSQVDRARPAAGLRCLNSTVFSPCWSAAARSRFSSWRTASPTCRRTASRVP
jgi:asparagine synthase (glutamine-hydrolysing)